MIKIAAYFLSLLLLFSTSLLAQNVGIGTTTPTNKLSVNGKMDIKDSLGIGTTNPAGRLHVKTLAYTALDQQQNLYNFISGSLVFWQSFTPGTTGLLAKVDLLVNSPLSSQSSPGTIKIFSGEGTGGTLLSTTNVTFLPVNTTFQSFTLSNAPAVVAGNVYTIEFSTPSANTSWAYSNSGNLYPNGRANLDADQDFGFKTYITSPESDALIVVDGKVGINTTSPVKELDVVGTTKTINLQITNGAANGSILKSDAVGNTSWSPISTIETDPKVGTLTSNKIPKWNGTALADGLLFDNGTNVGIGTTTPANKLSVNGKMDIRDSLGINTTNPIGELHVKSKATNTALDQQQTSANVIVGNTLQWQSFTAGITGLLTSIDLLVNSPITSQSSPGTIKIFSGEGNSGALITTINVTFQNVTNSFQSFPFSSPPSLVAGNIYTVEFSVPNMNRNWVYLRTGNAYPNGRSNTNINEDYVFKTYVTRVTDALVVMDGKLGINNTSPVKDLDVAGTIKTTNIQITNGSANGLILKSDAAGNASWATNTFTETDPKVGTLSTNKIPKWNGTLLADGVIFDNGVNVGIGTNSPSKKLTVVQPNGIGIAVLSGDVSANTSIGIGDIYVEGTINVASGPGQFSANAIAGDIILRTENAANRLILNSGSGAAALAINNGDVGVNTTTPITELDVNGGIRTKYSGTAVYDVVGGAVRTISMPIPTLPADWNVGNTIVIVTNADGVDGIVRQAKLTSLTNIDVKYIQDTNGLVRLNWVIFRM
jgi:hypothetical protein